jgi:hypothetical protein
MDLHPTGGRMSTVRELADDPAIAAYCAFLALHVATGDAAEELRLARSSVVTLARRRGLAPDLVIETVERSGCPPITGCERSSAAERERYRAAIDELRKLLDSD